VALSALQGDGSSTLVKIRASLANEPQCVRNASTAGTTSSYREPCTIVTKTTLHDNGRLQLGRCRCLCTLNPAAVSSK
jgi:hypothetical protein